MESAKSVCALLAGIYEPRMRVLDVDTFEVGDARELEFADNSFDVVLCMNVIPNLPPPPTSAISELLRVSSRYVLIRSLFADFTYLIRELLSENEEDSCLITADGSVPEDRYLYNNMYSEEYLRSVIREIDSSTEVGIESDESTVPIDNRTEHGAWGTRTDAGLQIAGQLVLDWRLLSRDR
jgi:SAM-dependent methyltransferase